MTRFFIDRLWQWANETTNLGEDIGLWLNSSWTENTELLANVSEIWRADFLAAFNYLKTEYSANFDMIAQSFFEKVEKPLNDKIIMEISDGYDLLKEYEQSILSVLPMEGAALLQNIFNFEQI